MKKALYCFMVSSFSVAMPSGTRFEQFQPKFKELKYYSNRHFTQMRFNPQNTRIQYNNQYQKQQKNYAPKPKGR